MYRNCSVIAEYFQCNCSVSHCSVISVCSACNVLQLQCNCRVLGWGRVGRSFVWKIAAAATATARSTGLAFAPFTPGILSPAATDKRVAWASRLPENQTKCTTEKPTYSKRNKSLGFFGYSAFLFPRHYRLLFEGTVNSPRWFEGTVNSPRSATSTRTTHSN